jgi:hypothetical protein
MRITLAFLFCLLLTDKLFAQDSTASFQFSDVDDKPIKRFCTQKVLNQSPNRFISIGYEYQGGFDFKAMPSSRNETLRFDRASGLRVGFYTPVISKNNIIVNLAGTYWRTNMVGAPYSFPYPMYQSLNSNPLQTAGLSATVFKPLNEKRFLLLQANMDANWQASSGASFNNQSFTYSGTAIYGWKPTEKLMWGLGVARTYRLGRLLHIPVLMYNQTFNEKWGIEAVLPARGAIRHNINKKSMLFAGYELEGNQYSLVTNGMKGFLQRGEIKPRLTYERSLSGFWWISIQAGMRVNGRFNVVDRYNGKETDQVFTTTLGNALYFNISLNLVSL